MNIQAVTEARTLVEQGMTANKATEQVAAEHGVAQRTVQRWLKEAGQPLATVATDTAAHARACARVERLAHIEEGLAILAEGFPALARSALGAEAGRDADGFMRAARGALEMIRLTEGDATSRIEHLGRDEFMSEVRRLAAELDALPG